MIWKRFKEKLNNQKHDQIEVGGIVKVRPTAVGLYAVFIVLCLSANNSFLFAQDSISAGKDKINGQIVTVSYEESDTLLVSDLAGVSVSVPRSFDDMDELIRYEKYKRYATKVYPYAVKSIKIFREVEEVTQTMNKRKRKKHIKRLHKELKKEFSDPLRNLSKTQGKILIEMIEKELDTSFYELMKGLRGGFTAGYWNTLSRMYGYRLKEKYQPGDDKILDAVLYDLDISHQLEK
ncbi:MAG: DUF4294 domain-containing protein [Bacteroidota bacterium]